MLFQSGFELRKINCIVNKREKIAGSLLADRGIADNNYDEQQIYYDSVIQSSH